MTTDEVAEKARAAGRQEMVVEVINRIIATTDLYCFSDHGRQTELVKWIRKNA